MDLGSADFRNVKSIRQRDKDIVYGYMKRIQLIFPMNNPYYTINQLIQDLCLLYFHAIIDTNILSQSEQIKLIEMVSIQTQYKFHDNWKLLFRASKHGFKRKDFYKQCNNMSNTLCIIQSPENNVFGGYTSLKQDKSKCKYISTYENDGSAFVYSIRSNKSDKQQIFPALESKNAIQHDYLGYLSFGNAFHVQQYDNYAALVIAGQKHCNIYMDHHRLNGSEIEFSPIDIEVFQLEPR